LNGLSSLYLRCTNNFLKANFMKQTTSTVLKLKPSLLTLLFLCVAVLLQIVVMPQAQAAGLGKMRVLSALGAPFSAEVEVTNIRPEEEGNMVVRIASPDVFKQAGIDYNSALPTIRATLAGDAANPKIILNSASAINEPLLEMLVEMSWQSGRMVRQYTVLLDPVNPVNDALVNNDPIQTPAPQMVSTNTALNQVPAPTVAMDVAQNTSALNSPNAASTAANPSTGTKNYDVQRGDTLLGIASRLSGSDSYQVKALMATLLQNNPHAFINNNINRLKAGVVLNTDGNGLPTNTTNRGLAGAQLNNSNRAPSRAFSQYKQAATQSVRPLLEKNGSTKTVKNSVKADVLAKAAATQDQLKVSGNATVGNQSAAGSGKSNEAQIAKDRAIAEEKSRIAELEKNIKKSVEIKNSVLTSPQASKPESSKLGAPSSVSPNAVAAGAAVATTAVVASSSAAKSTAPESVNTQPATPAAPTTSASSASVLNTPTAAAQPPVNAALAGTTPPTIKKPTQPVVEEPSWYENIDPLTLGGVGGVVALLGGWALYRRKKSSESIAFSDSTFNSKDTQGGLLTAQGGQAVDTFNSVFVSNFSEANMPMESAEVDPIAEADVYMQYGRDAHAEDILVDALKQNPARHPVRLKLMELYASKGNQSDLNTQFDTLSTLTQATGAEWLAGKKLVDASNSGQSSANVTRVASAVDVGSSDGSDGSDGSDLAILPMNTAIGNTPISSKPFKNSNLAIDNIKLSAPTRIGDVANNTLNTLNSNMNSALNSGFTSNINLSGGKSTAIEQNPTGLNFDIQSPTVLGRSNASAGIGMPAKQSFKTEPDSLLEFKVSKVDTLQASKHTRVDSQPSSILDKLTSNSGASVTPALETKLSLAKAYTDIGDKEGARELLQEVIDAGHQSLSEQAKALLIKL
jgi:pilus assembly protein FimV